MVQNLVPFAFRDPVINIYVRDVEGVASFYRENFGFEESFRTPKDGQPVHIELRLQAFTLGLASIEAAKSMHGLPLNPGLPRSEVALWTEDVDQVVYFLRKKGVPVISEPHTFIDTVRAAWVLDPEGNHVQVVCKVKSK
jgi:lactoylglutathione lyase